MNNSSKFIDFIITQKCTYKCAYCSQSKGEVFEKNNADKKTIYSFLNFLDRIDKDFEITITGGEALLHPDFFYLIEQIKNKGFKINLITNLSFEIDKYNKIFLLLDKSLNRFDISFHFDEIVDFENFIKKLREILKIRPNGTVTSFLIPIYNFSSDKEIKIEKISEIAKKFDIECIFQQIHYYQKYIKNSEHELKYIQNQPLNTFSKFCYAGSKSAVIYENGECYRCYSSRFFKSNYLGNINDKNFELNLKPLPCVHKYCTCPKVKSYNQITEKKSLFFANCARIYNFIFLPYFAIKDFKILKAKFKQFSKMNK